MIWKVAGLPFTHCSHTKNWSLLIQHSWVIRFSFSSFQWERVQTTCLCARFFNSRLSDKTGCQPVSISCPFLHWLAGVASMLGGKWQLVLYYLNVSWPVRQGTLIGLQGTKYLSVHQLLKTEHSLLTRFVTELLSGKGEVEMIVRTPAKVKCVWSLYHLVE